MSTLAWAPLTGDDLPALASLARACLRADGGLPHLAGETMLRRLFLADAGIGGRDETGDLVAAAAVFVDGGGRRTATGLVRPSARRQGLGDQLVAWCAERSGGAPLRVLTETSSPDTGEFLRRYGLVQTFGEHVMRHGLADIPRIRRPAGTTVLPWHAATASLFHAAYVASFADRPGFPDPAPGAADWVAAVGTEPGFHPDWSRVALADDGTPVGFVTLVDDWVDQVGVIPTWRGRALGAHLVVRSLRRFRKAGMERAWLSVNVDNPAYELYLRLGFADAGLRARYEPVIPPGPSDGAA
ncbi:MAG: GNAT family N-acetyltransferase [Phycicoccus sp.]